MKLKNWNLFELIWIIAFSAVSLVLSIMWKDTVLGFSVFFTGVVSVVLAAKGNIWNYAFGIYNSLGYAWVSFQSGLFGGAMLNALYFFPMQFVGWYLWKKKTQGNTVIMRKMALKGFLTLIFLCVIFTLILGCWLSTLKGQNTPYIDSFTTVLSIIAMVLMTQRYKEQWILFICVNSVSIIMWSYRLVSGSPEAATMVVMWSAYLVSSIYGLINWSKGVSYELKDMAPAVVSGGNLHE